MASKSSAAYLVISADNYGPNLWVVTLFCLALSSVAILARLAAKRTYQLSFAVDDYAIIGAFGVAVIQHGLLIVALKRGLGKTVEEIDAQNGDAAAQYFFSSQIVLLTSLYAAKCSMILVLQQLFFLSRWMKWVWLPIVTAGVASILAIAPGCTPSLSLLMRSDPRCPNRIPRWAVITTLDVITETVLVALPIYCLRSVQMNMTGKWKVMLSFSARLLSITFSILFIWSYSRSLRSSNTGTAIVIPAIFQQCNLTVSLVTVALLPCFRLLFQSSEKVGYTTNSKVSDGPLRSGILEGVDDDSKGSRSMSSSSTSGKSGP